MSNIDTDYDSDKFPDKDDDFLDDAADALEEHEAAIDAETGTEDDIDPEQVEQMKAVQAMTDRVNDLEAKLIKAQREAVMAKLRNNCTDTIIGGTDANSVHPYELDLVCGTSPAQLLANLQHQFGESHEGFGCPVVLVPVPVWPMAVQNQRNPFSPLVYRDGPKKGQPIPNYDVGRTFIRETQLGLDIIVEGIRRHISFNGMAALSVNMIATPDDVRDRLAKREARDQFQVTGYGDPGLDDVFDSGEGVFIPSQHLDG